MSAELSGLPEKEIAERRKYLEKELSQMTLQEVINLMPYAHIKFADEYLISLNKAQAFRISNGNPDMTAHYSRAQGNGLFKDKFVQAYIRLRMAEKDEERIARQDEVLEFLSDVMRNNYKKLGYSKDLYIKDRIQAAELVGKRYALFTDKIQGQLQLEPLQIEIIDAIQVSDVNEN